MKSASLVTWVLRVGVAGEFIGHGAFALQGKATWIEWIESMLGVSTATAQNLLTAIGVADVLVGVIVLIAPIPIVLLWAAIWGFWTALVRPLVGEPFWDFVERFANWAAPLALLLVGGWPTSLAHWFRARR
ncbi:hypothetical protein HYS28_02505 [Candidatus Uhrbacteria bacterium]|nr:hypothetical protein [Candidatus Uhrbacteria bacterium]